MKAGPGLPVVWTLRPQESILEFEFADGEVRSLPMPASMWPPGSHSRWVRNDLRAQELTIGLPLREEQATLELRAGRDAAVLRRGRLIVYLDTNAWSWVATVHHGRGLPAEAETAAARRLIERAEDDDVLLPFSAGHLVELTRRFDAPRVEHACTVLQLSRGWRMRNPVHVRTEEMVEAMAADGAARPAVFAPTADGFFTESIKPSPPADFPEPLATLYVEGVEAMGVLETMLEPDAIPDEGGLSAASGWAVALQDMSRQMRAEGRSREEVRRFAGARVLMDLAAESVQAAKRAGVNLEQAVELLLSADDPVGKMPYLARQRGVITGRLADPKQRWEANDLIDINNLCCAAGYADVIVCERNAAHYLRASRPIPAGAVVTRRLSEAVKAVEAMLELRGPR